MVTVRIKGGLGNQLFQYASSYAISKRLEQGLLIDNSFFSSQTLRGYKLPYLNVEYTKVDDDRDAVVELYKNKFINKLLRMAKCSNLPIKNGTYFLETKSKVMDDLFTICKDSLYLDGYFQSEEYFKEYRKELLEQFTPNYVAEQEYLDELSKIENCNSIAVHVRRGDFLKAQHDFSSFHYLLSEQYYIRTLEYVVEHIDNPCFFWFSDDIDWVKSCFGEKSNYHFVQLHTKHADIDELMLMKNCRHIICANSTFSWWASWLNENRDVLHICPEKPYGGLDMIPSSWVKIAVE